MPQITLILGTLIATVGPLASQCPVGSSRSFGPGGFGGSTWASIVHDDGSGPKLYVGDSFQSIDGVFASRIARFYGQGREAVGGGIDGPVYALHRHEFGAGPRLVAAGSSANAGGTPTANVAAWDPRSTPEATSRAWAPSRRRASPASALGRGATSGRW